MDPRIGGPRMADPAGLPPGLPVPLDDGACDHLAGISMPSVRLRSTRGREVDIAEVSMRPTVMFFYPAATGKPDMPKEWDLIPGARGCTSQNCAYRDHYREFRDLGLEVFGISAQRPEDQKEFAGRLGIPYELLSDSDFELTVALRPSARGGLREPERRPEAFARLAGTVDEARSAKHALGDRDLEPARASRGVRPGVTSPSSSDDH